MPSQRAARSPLGELFRSARERLREAGVPDPALEAEALICHALGIDPVQLWTNDGPVPASRRRRFEAQLLRRLRREPLPYIRGWAEFFGRRFDVDQRVLIPRPETEHLVEIALEWERATFSKVQESGHPLRVADIGTGSGILAITLALELPRVQARAVDISREALYVARKNARRHSVTQRVKFHHGNLTGPLRGRFEVVLANLPYIKTARLSRLEPELSNEPRLALDGGGDGLEQVRPLIQSLPGYLAVPGLALLEIDPPIARRALAIAIAAFGAGAARVESDLSGLARVLVIESQ